jgi:hypothetical protein
METAASLETHKPLPRPVLIAFIKQIIELHSEKLPILATLSLQCLLLFSRPPLSHFLHRSFFSQDTFLGDALFTQNFEVYCD